MHRTMKFFTLTLVLVLLGAGTSFASSVLPDSYGTATHDTTQWQELAGISWSLDDGDTWGNETLLHVGDTIQFKFNMYKQQWGNHYADFLKAWVDWDQEGSFDADEVVAFGKQVLEGNGDVYSGMSYTFLSTSFSITEEMIGELYLRARVTCSHSLAKLMGGIPWNEQKDVSDEDYDEYFAATGHLGQGEVEEWTLTVAATPLPPSLLLFGSGLIGILAMNRKRFMQ